MRIARSFSTIIWRSRQALYEPYVAPLNEEQKKALRKLMAKGNAHYHGQLNKDVRRLLQFFQPSGSILLRRKQTIEHIEQIIKAAYGPEYSVIDRSMYNYARDISCAPLELAVHDSSRPKGFLPGTEDQPLPDPYNHEALAKLFEKHGFTGCFIAGDTARTTSSDAQKTIKHYYTTGERGDLPVNPPWTSFTPRPVPHLTYPIVLHAEHISDATMPFFLSPPMPTHLPLVQLLAAYCSLNCSYSDLIALIFIWIRSIDLPQLTPTCIALMVIGYLQVQKSVPSLQNPRYMQDIETLAKRNEGVWLQAEWRPRYPPKAFWLETGFISKPTLETSLTDEDSSTNESAPRTNLETRPKKMGPLLHDFFQFWSQEHTSRVFICSDRALSVRQGTMVPRAPVMRAARGPLRRDEENRAMIHRGMVPWSPTSEPIMWQSHPIALPDPFIPSYNHAQSLTKAAGAYFHHFSSLSYRTLFRGHSLATVLGPHMPYPNSVISRPTHLSNREYSTSSLGHQAKEFYESMVPPPAVFAARARTISRVQRVIKAKFGGTYFVECFGSTQYGVSSATSDLDLVVMDSSFKTGFSPKFRRAQLPAIYNINQVARALSKNGFNQVVTVPKATVPIVKFHDPSTDLECDLNINDRLGLWNTRLISKYCDLSSDLARPMIMVIKRWAKSHGLNDASGRTGPASFSSYALVLMVIGFLQIKGLLPNLQGGLEELPKAANRGVFWIRKKKSGPVRCDIRFSHETVWKPETHMELDEALKGWFMFWASEFDYANDLLSVRMGGLVKRATKAVKDKKGKNKKGKNKKGKNKPKKTKAIPLVEWQESIRELDEEKAIAAWRNQKEDEDEDEEDEEDEENEEDEGEEFEHEEVSEVETADEDRNGALGDPGGEEGEAVGAARRSESQSTTLALQDQLQEQNIDDRASDEGLEHSACEIEAGCVSSEGSVHEGKSGKPEPSQPTSWLSHPLIIVDPFILDKNVCGQIARSSIKRFQDECHRAVFTLSEGDLVDVMGIENSLPESAVQRRGKKRGSTKNTIHKSLR